MSAEDPQIGKTLLGRYRVVRRLAKGGMGIVYLARAEGAAGFIKPVVIKRILPELDQPEMTGMFVREAKILGNLRHPGIAGIVDFGEEDGAYVMVLEYVHGYDLGRWRRYVAHAHARFDFELALHLAIEVLEALHHAHSATRPDGTSLGIVHRDVSPSNIVIDTEGRVVLLDFGVARMQGETGMYKTETVTVKGKLSYISPEQLAGVAPSVASDVYAVGVVLHELLLGSNEFRGAEAPETMARVLTHLPSRISSTRTDVPEGLDGILGRALAKKPEDRFASALEMADALRALRVLTTEEARAELLRAIREDYPKVPAVVGVESLEVLDQAWRTAPSREERTPSHTEPIPQPPRSEPPTRAEPLTGRRSAVLVAPARRRTGLAVAIGGLVVVSLAALGLAYAGVLERPAAAPEQVFVVSEPSPSDAPATRAQPDEAQPDEGEPLDEEGADLVADAEQGPRRSSAQQSKLRIPPRGEALTATFSREGARVERCLREHASGIEGSPRLDVHFTLEASGEVRSARVLPEDVGALPLGRCIAAVARSLRFAPQAREGVSFRIPITVARR